MPQYIDREAFLEDYRNRKVVSLTSQGLIAALKDYPTVNIQPRETGKWEGQEFDVTRPARFCSHCGELAPVGLYCNRCGTRMKLR